MELRGSCQGESSLLPSFERRAALHLLPAQDELGSPNAAAAGALAALAGWGRPPTPGAEEEQHAVEWHWRRGLVGGGLAYLATTLLPGEAHHAHLRPPREDWGEGGSACWG